MNTKLLRELRKQHGYTQQEVADKINMSRTAYVKLEGGGSHGTIDAALALSKLYENYPLEKLIESEKSITVRQCTAHLDDQQGRPVQIKMLQVQGLGQDEELKALLVQVLENQAKQDERHNQLLEMLRSMRQQHQ